MYEVVVTVVIRGIHHLQMENLGLYLCIGISSKAIFEDSLENQHRLNIVQTSLTLHSARAIFDLLIHIR